MTGKGTTPLVQLDAVTQSWLDHYAATPPQSSSIELVPFQPKTVEPAVVATPVPSVPPTRGWWNATGRGVVGVMLIGAGVAIAVTSMQATAWQGHVLAIDADAGDIFSRWSVLAEFVGCALPTANQFYRDDGDWRAALKGTAVMVVALMVVFLSASGFVLTNLSGATAIRAEQATPTVAIAERALADAKTARDRECVKVGPVCRQREDAVTDRQRKLDEAKAEVRAGADPQAEAFGVTPAQLRTARAGAMVLMCLAAGYVIALGSGLVFGRRRGFGKGE